MALVKYGAGIVAMSGSIAGDVHARNRFGNYKRPRTKPVNPKSQRQSAIRVIMQFLAEQWREAPMDDAIRIAWQTYADSVNWNNRLGEQVTLTGFNMFIMCNSARLSLGDDLITAGPAALGLPAGDPAFQISNVSAAGQNYDVAFDDGFDWVTEDGGYLALYQGQPVSASHTFFGGPFRAIGPMKGIDPGGCVQPAIGQTDKGFTFVLGQKIWWEARVIRKDGRISTRFRCDPTIVEA